MFIRKNKNLYFNMERKPKFKFKKEWEQHVLDDSSQIKAVAYDNVYQTMYVRFSNDSVYSYRPVKKEIFDALVNAPSAGVYFHKKIKKDKEIIYKQM